MSVYETSITNPKKQLEFYKDLSEQLQQENQKYKEVIDKTTILIKGIAYGGNEDYYIEKIKNILDILKEVK